jgi:hypothetical protein
LHPCRKAFIAEFAENSPENAEKSGEIQLGSVTRMPTVYEPLSVIFQGDVHPGWRSSVGSYAGEEPASMDSIVMIMFASVLCTMTALNFIELRRIRKKLETKQS